MSDNKGGRPKIWETVEEFKKDIEKFKQTDEPQGIMHFCAWKGIDRQTWYNYSEFEDFELVQSAYKDYAESQLVKMGLIGKYNPTVLKMVLQKYNDYSDKAMNSNVNAIEITVKDYIPENESDIQD